jgi:hypothetical protein
MGVSSNFCKRRMDWKSAAGDAGEIARNGDVGFFWIFSFDAFGCACSKIFLREAWIGGEVWVMVQANSQGTVLLVFGILLPPRFFYLSPPFNSFGCVHFKQFSRTMD